MLKPKTYAVYILDRSSSMMILKEEAIAGFNEQLELLKEKSKDHRVRVGLITFASEVDKPTIWNKMPSAIKPLTGEDYQPNGMTAFYDGLDLAINKLMEIEDVKNKKASVLIVSITDGHENNSTIKGPQLSAKIKELEAGGNWTFTVMGANINLSQLKDNLGIDIGNTMSFNSTSVGTREANAAINCSLDSYFVGRSRGLMRSANFYDGKDKDEDVDLSVLSGSNGTADPQPNNHTLTTKTA